MTAEIVDLTAHRQRPRAHVKKMARLATWLKSFEQPAPIPQAEIERETRRIHNTTIDVLRALSLQHTIDLYMAEVDRLQRMQAGV